MSICPHCNDEIGFGDGRCMYDSSPDCWELKHLSASPDVQAEIWVTRDEQVPLSVARLVDGLDGIERP